MAIESRSNHKRLKVGSMGVRALLLTVFCCVSGGPFGLEPLVGEAGPGLALVLILIIPVVWAIPDALTTAELAPAIPVEGGYVIWVRRAMGPFAGFLNAWWTWIYTLVDAAIYPAMFASYALSLAEATLGWKVRENDSLTPWALGAVVVVIFTTINIRGTKLVGKTSSLFAGLILLPFLLMVVVGLVRYGANPHPLNLPFLAEGKSMSQALSSGLGIVMWNYLGWDALSTIAEEVEDPAKAYPTAIFGGVPLVTLVYILPTLVGLMFFANPAKWQEGVWPEIAQAVGGDWLLWPMQVAALIAPVALFTASLLGSSRVPFVLAEERFLPKGLVEIHPKFGTPWRAIILCGVIYLVLITKTFSELVELNVIMYGAALVLETLALLVLRVKEPNLPRPFKVPGGWPVLILVFLLPVSMVFLLGILSFQEDMASPDGLQKQLPTMVGLASAPIVYFCVRLAQRFAR